ncbi:MAG: tetratricopeptide repeat protein, partial [Candidatus Gastranaerophilales bacterium]|nr:tetratricopeptide repeat protein [Candidatus Gastranaerophilales bacterium]
MDNMTNAIEYLSKKDFSSALVELNKILENDKNNLEALKNAGLCYFNLKDYENSAKMFQRAREIDNDDATALYYLASLAILMNNSEDAINYSKKVIALRPEFFDAYKILFSIYLKEKRFKDIMELQKEFSSKNVEATDDTIHMIIATTYMLNKDYKNALYWYKLGHKN